ncbi:NF038396 family protein [Pseudarthrobacter sp. J1738]|uniref:NF038396 family protein n=1 Tax=unclassified Pseudarthrobacter TaxID=2647000 RepID=UPI003D2E76F7
MLKRPEALFVLGYMLLPLFALLSAIVGLTMILSGQKIIGAIVLVILTQVFVFGSMWALRTRKRVVLLEQNPGSADS